MRLQTALPFVLLILFAGVCFAGDEPEQLLPALGLVIPAGGLGGLSNKHLLELRGDALNKARNILDTAKAQKRELNTQERQTWEEAMQDVDAIDQARAEERQKIEAATGMKLIDTSDPNFKMPIYLHNQSRAAGGVPNLSVPLASWLKNAYGQPIPPSDFEASIRAGYDPRSQGFDIELQSGGRPTAGLQIMNSIDRSGASAIVPTEVLPRLESALKQFGPMLRTSEVLITQTGHEQAWPTIDDTDNVGSQIGEATDVGTADDLTFLSQLFTPWKFTTGILRASHELIRDSAINLSVVIADKLGERLARIINTRATNGVGTTTLSGITLDASVGKTAAAQAAIAFDELIQLVHSVDPAYRAMPGTGWMMNDATASAVRRLKDDNLNYLWQPSNQAGQPPLLLGYPVHINQDLDDMAAESIPIVFGDLASYKIRIVGKIRLRTLTERYAELDQLGFVGFIEADGHLLKPSSSDALCPVRSLQMAA